MDTIKNISDIVERLKKLRGLKKDSEIASLLGMSGTALYNHKVRGSIPYEALSTFCEKEHVSLDWLLFGKRQTQGEAEEQAPFNSDFLREVIIGVEEFLKEEGKDLEPKDKATLITTLFTEAQKMEAEGLDASSRAFRLSRLIARFVGSH